MGAAVSARENPAEQGMIDVQEPGANALEAETVAAIQNSGQFVDPCDETTISPIPPNYLTREALVDLSRLVRSRLKSRPPRRSSAETTSTAAEATKTTKQIPPGATKKTIETTEKTKETIIDDGNMNVLEEKEVKKTVVVTTEQLADERQKQPAVQEVAVSEGARKPTAKAPVLTVLRQHEVKGGDVEMREVQLSHHHNPLVLNRLPEQTVRCVPQNEESEEKREHPLVVIQKVTRPREVISPCPPNKIGEQELAAGRKASAAKELGREEPTTVPQAVATAREEIQEGSPRKVERLPKAEKKQHDHHTNEGEREKVSAVLNESFITRENYGRESAEGKERPSTVEEKQSEPPVKALIQKEKEGQNEAEKHKVLQSPRQYPMEFVEYPSQPPAISPGLVPPNELIEQNIAIEGKPPEAKERKKSHQVNEGIQAGETLGEEKAKTPAVDTTAVSLLREPTRIDDGATRVEISQKEKAPTHAVKAWEHPPRRQISRIDEGAMEGKPSTAEEGQPQPTTKVVILKEGGKPERTTVSHFPRQHHMEIVEYPSQPQAISPGLVPPNELTEQNIAVEEKATEAKERRKPIQVQEGAPAREISKKEKAATPTPAVKLTEASPHRELHQIDVGETRGETPQKGQASTHAVKASEPPPPKEPSQIGEGTVRWIRSTAAEKQPAPMKMVIQKEAEKQRVAEMPTVLPLPRQHRMGILEYPSQPPAISPGLVPPNELTEQDIAVEKKAPEVKDSRKPPQVDEGIPARGTLKEEKAATPTPAVKTTEASPHREPHQIDVRGTRGETPQKGQASTGAVKASEPPPLKEPSQIGEGTVRREPSTAAEKQPEPMKAVIQKEVEKQSGAEKPTLLQLPQQLLEIIEYPSQPPAISPGLVPPNELTEQDIAVEKKAPEVKDSRRPPQVDEGIPARGTLKEEKAATPTPAVKTTEASPHREPHQIDVGETRGVTPEKGQASTGAVKASEPPPPKEPSQIGEGTVRREPSKAAEKQPEPMKAVIQKEVEKQSGAEKPTLLQLPQQLLEIIEYPSQPPAISPGLVPPNELSEQNIAVEKKAPEVKDSRKPPQVDKGIPARGTLKEEKAATPTLAVKTTEAAPHREPYQIDVRETRGETPQKGQAPTGAVKASELPPPKEPSQIGDGTVRREPSTAAKKQPEPMNAVIQKDAEKQSGAEKPTLLQLPQQLVETIDYPSQPPAISPGLVPPNELTEQDIAVEKKAPEVKDSRKPPQVDEGIPARGTLKEEKAATPTLAVKTTEAAPHREPYQIDVRETRGETPQKGQAPTGAVKASELPPPKEPSQIGDGTVRRKPSTAAEEQPEPKVGIQKEAEKQSEAEKPTLLQLPQQLVEIIDYPSQPPAISPGLVPPNELTVQDIAVEGKASEVVEEKKPLQLDEGISEKETSKKEKAIIPTPVMKTAKAPRHTSPRVDEGARKGEIAQKEISFTPSKRPTETPSPRGPPSKDLSKEVSYGKVEPQKNSEPPVSTPSGSPVAKHHSLEGDVSGIIHKQPPAVSPSLVPANELSRQSAPVKTRERERSPDSAPARLESTPTPAPRPPISKESSPVQAMSGPVADESDLKNRATRALQFPAEVIGSILQAFESSTQADSSPPAKTSPTVLPNDLMEQPVQHHEIGKGPDLKESAKSADRGSALPSAHAVAPPAIETATRPKEEGLTMLPPAATKEDSSMKPSRKTECLLVEPSAAAKKEGSSSKPPSKTEKSISMLPAASKKEDTSIKRPSNEVSSTRTTPQPAKKEDSCAKPPSKTEWPTSVLPGTAQKEDTSICPSKGVPSTRTPQPTKREDSSAKPPPKTEKSISVLPAASKKEYSSVKSSSKRVSSTRTTPQPAKREDSSAKPPSKTEKLTTVHPAASKKEYSSIKSSSKRVSSTRTTPQPAKREDSSAKPPSKTEKLTTVHPAASKKEYSSVKSSSKRVSSTRTTPQPAKREDSSAKPPSKTEESISMLLGTAQKKDTSIKCPSKGVPSIRTPAKREDSSAKPPSKTEKSTSVHPAASKKDYSSVKRSSKKVSSTRTTPRPAKRGDSSAKPPSKTEKSISVLPAASRKEYSSVKSSSKRVSSTRTTPQPAKREYSSAKPPSKTEKSISVLPAASRKEYSSVKSSSKRVSSTRTTPQPAKREDSSAKPPSKTEESISMLPGTAQKKDTSIKCPSKGVPSIKTPAKREDSSAKPPSKKEKSTSVHPAASKKDYSSVKRSSKKVSSTRTTPRPAKRGDSSAKLPSKTEESISMLPGTAQKEDTSIKCPSKGVPSTRTPAKNEDSSAKPPSKTEKSTSVHPAASKKDYSGIKRSSKKVSSTRTTPQPAKKEDSSSKPPSKTEKSTSVLSAASKKEYSSIKRSSKKVSSTRTTPQPAKKEDSSAKPPSKTEKSISMLPAASKNEDTSIKRPSTPPPEVGSSTNPPKFDQECFVTKPPICDKKEDSSVKPSSKQEFLIPESSTKSQIKEMITKPPLEGSCPDAATLKAQQSERAAAGKFVKPVMESNTECPKTTIEHTKDGTVFRIVVVERKDMTMKSEEHDSPTLHTAESGNPLKSPLQQRAQSTAVESSVQHEKHSAITKSPARTTHVTTDVEVMKEKKRTLTTTTEEDVLTAKEPEAKTDGKAKATVS